MKEPAAEITRRERAGRFENARVINCVLLWYETVRNVHAMGAPESDITSTEAECVKKIKEPAAKKKAAPKASTS